MRSQIQGSVAELVRTMNCYYSNLIEGHRTTPREIDAALRESYSDDPKKKDLQIEARHHINTPKKKSTRQFYTMKTQWTNTFLLASIMIFATNFRKRC